MLIEFSLEAGAALLGCHRAQTVEHTFVRQAHERQRQTSLSFLIAPVVVNRKMEHDHVANVSMLIFPPVDGPGRVPLRCPSTG